MIFTPQTLQNPSEYLAGLELRIKAAFDATKTQRVGVPATAAASYALVTVSWPAPFADTNYTVVATTSDTGASAGYGAWVRRIASKTTDAVVVQVNTSEA